MDINEETKLIDLPYEIRNVIFSKLHEIKSKDIDDDNLQEELISLEIKSADMKSDEREEEPNMTNTELIESSIRRLTLDKEIDDIERIYTKARIELRNYNKILRSKGELVFKR